MTVTVTTARVEYTGNGSTTAFTVPFYFLANGDLKVYQAGVLKTITTHYTVSGAGNPAGGTVTFGTAPTSGQSVVIFRDPALTQSTDYTPNDPFPAESHERALDRLTMIAQRNRELVDRAFHLADGDTSGASTVIPSPEANTVVSWNSQGTALVNRDPSDFATALTYADRRVETFTGDGVTVDFTLAETPAVVANTDVDIEGVSQVPGVDYQLLADGLTLRFDVAPPNGQTIAVKYGQAVAQSRDDAATVYFAPAGTGAVSRTVQNKLREIVSVMDFGAIGNGTTDDYSKVALADAYASFVGAELVFPAGTYVINTSHSFAASVRMAGGVLSGSGALSFPHGFSSAPYYCFDCLVGQIQAEVLCAEWFGARQSTATPTSTSISISSKPWNAWPSFINNANYLTKQNYGNGTFLAANKPFSNSDTWDFIAIQRALWSIGVVTSGVGRGEVRLLARGYYLTRAVRFVGDMAATLRGAGRTKSLLYFTDHSTHEEIAYSAGNGKSLLSFYKTGPDPIYVADLACIGPTGYTPGSDTLYLVGLINSNGITFDNCWIAVGEASIYMDDSTSDLWVRGCMFEYSTRQIYGYDAGSWCQVVNSGFWTAGTAVVGVQVAGYAFVTGCTFVSFSTSFILGAGSHLSGCTFIENGTGYRSIVDGRVISRRMRFSAGTTRTVLTVKMGQYSAVRTRMVAGGVVQGVGASGIERTLTWYRETTNPVAAGSAATEWGTAGAIALISEGVATSTDLFSLQITNTGTSGEHFDADVTVFVEGSDFVLEGL